jgi:hypothetical protein
MKVEQAMLEALQYEMQDSMDREILNEMVQASTQANGRRHINSNSLPRK